MKVIFLGTASSFPTKDRNHVAHLLVYGGESFLFDCGEGTQRQIRIAEQSPMKINHIFLSHWHGDHSLGLPGLLQSMAMNRRKTPLYVYGPKGTKQSIDYMFKAFQMPNDTMYKVHVREISAPTTKTVLETDSYKVETINVPHRTPCLGFSFKEKDKIKIDTAYLKKFGLTQHPILKELKKGKDIAWDGKKIKAKDATTTKAGKKIAIISDTGPSPNITKLAKNSDLFICEATFANALKDIANERGHITAKQAAKYAKDAKVKQLILTHFSQRYKDVRPLVKEAQSVFKNTNAARDFLTVSI